MQTVAIRLAACHLQLRASWAVSLRQQWEEVSSKSQEFKSKGDFVPGLLRRSSLRAQPSYVAWLILVLPVKDGFLGAQVV